MLGPSGSGKTTTLRMIAGFEDPTEGTIELAGEDVSGVPPYDRKVNTVFQDYALFPHMTVGENVAYGLKVARVRQGRARANAATRRWRWSACRGYGDAQAGRALRRPAAAGRAGAGDRQPAQGAAPRRAARRPRPEAARGDADRAEGDPGRGRDHLRLRHPRPGRGADDERPDRRLQRRPDRAGELAARALRAPGQRVRRRLRRRLQPDRAGRRADDDPPREDRAACSLALRPTASTRRAAASSTSPTPAAITRFTIQLDKGEKLQLVRQNVESASSGALPGQGNEVLVGWRPEHAAAVGGKSTKQEVAPS